MGPSCSIKSYSPLTYLPCVAYLSGAEAEPARETSITKPSSIRRPFFSFPSCQYPICIYPTQQSCQQPVPPIESNPPWWNTVILKVILDICQTKKKSPSRTSRSSAKRRDTINPAKEEHTMMLHYCRSTGRSARISRLTVGLQTIPTSPSFRCRRCIQTIPRYGRLAQVKPTRYPLRNYRPGPIRRDSQISTSPLRPTISYTIS